ncbi:MAG TPA: proline dehydrogenase family protein [Vicinamibacteria bacterium]|nr:proline dehydrogenase family protein [Vicinamibacteria bacterium]
MRTVLLAGSESRWLRENATRRRFVRRAVARFMPGETLDDALSAAAALGASGLGAVLSRLGEHVSGEAEADEVASHYLHLLEVAAGRGVEVSVKPTLLGLAQDEEACARRLLAIAARAEAAGSYLWIDMEQTAFTDATLRLCRRARERHRAVGVCLQSYLRRTGADLEALLPTGAGVRLVKGAYHEPVDRAFARKVEVDASFLALARRLLDAAARGSGVRTAMGTHDRRMIDEVGAEVGRRGLPRAAAEFHLLFGIQRGEQQRLAGEGWPVRVLVSYGSHWFPWYMRRLAERPANVWFVARSLVAR